MLTTPKTIGLLAVPVVLAAAVISASGAFAKAPAHPSAAASLATPKFSAQGTADAAKPAVVQTFASTPEHRGRAVDAFYQQLLHRTTDDAGKTFWTSYLANHSTDDLRTTLVGTPEYSALHGNSDSAFRREAETVL